MNKFLITVVLVSLAFATPSFADEMAKCDADSLKKIEMELKAMTDPAMKDKMEMGMKELEMAMMSDKEKKMDDCAMHLDKAMKAAHGG